MKLKIDTTTKVIQVESQCKLVELFDFVKKIFPDNQWKEYSIEAVPVIYNWNNPIYIPYPTPTTYPLTPVYTYTDLTVAGSAVAANDGTFCITAIATN